MMLNRIKNKMHSDEGATTTVEIVIAIAFVIMIAVIIFSYWAQIANDQTDKTQQSFNTTLDKVDSITDKGIAELDKIRP